MGKLKALGLSIITLTLLIGCGSDGGDSVTTTTTSGTSLSGTAAAGAPIIGSVTVKGSQGGIVSEPIEADGSYSVDVSTLTAPYMLRAQGYVGGTQYTLHSYAEESDLGNTINVTPFTDLIIANAASSLASTYFDNGTFDLTEQEIAAEEQALQEKLSTVLASLGIADTIDLLRTSFAADHSDLDAALDIVRVEVNTSTSVATLTNLIDNTTIVDNLVDDTLDSATPLEVVSDLGTVETEYTAINNRIASFNALFATSLPTPTQVGAYLGASFLDYDTSRDALITEITTDPTMIGWEFTNTVISDLNLTAGTAKLTYTDVWGQTYMYMEKVNNEWLLLGNQEVADVDLSFQCIIQPTLAGSPIGCGVNMYLEDIDGTNNNGQGPIQSAKVTIVRNGVDVNDSTVYLGENGGVSQLYIYDGVDYADDYLEYFYDGSVTIDPSLIHDGDVARFDIYDGPLDISTPTAPAVTGNLVASYTRYIPKAPVSVAEAEAHSYPVVAQSTIDALNSYTNGDILIEWTLPSSDIKSDDVWLQFTDNTTTIGAQDNLALSGGSSTTLTLDISSLNTPYYYWLGVYSKDQFGRSFTAQIFP